MGHHIDTRYAFNDRLLFPEESTFQRIDMNHSDVDNAAASKKAMEYLQASMYKDRLPTAGLYYEQLADRAKVLKGLNTPALGDSLLRADGTPWMADLEHMAPKLNWDDLAQTPALPLGSWLKTDPWDDKVHMLSAKLYAPINAREKMPLEVTPINYKLQRYDLAQNTPAPTPGAGPAAQPAGTDPPTANTPSGQPTDGDGTAGNTPAAKPAAGGAPAGAPVQTAATATDPPAAVPPVAQPAANPQNQQLSGTSNPPQQ
jgi:hypothetical protein